MNQPHKFQMHEVAFLVSLVLLSIGGLLYISQSFLLNIVFAAIITLSTFPFFLKIKDKFNLNNTKASIITTIGVGLVLLTPITYVLTVLGVEGASLYNYIQSLISSIDFSSKEAAVNSIVEKIKLTENYQDTVKSLLVSHVDIQSVAKMIKDFFFFASQNALGSVFGTLGFFLISMFTMFFLYRDGEVIVQKIKEISPLHDYYDTLLMREMARLSGILTLSIITIAFLQGVAFSLIAVFLDLNWLFLGVAVALTSFIPVFGTMLIWLPLGIYLYITGNEWQGIFVLLWGAIVIGTIIDNVLRPFIIGYICKLFDTDNKEIQKEEDENFNPLNHTFIVVISTLGGMLKFGVIGLFLGPIIAGIAISVIELYRIRMKAVNDYKESEESLNNENRNLSDAESLLDEANDTYQNQYPEGILLQTEHDFEDPELESITDLDELDEGEELDDLDDIDDLEDIDKEFEDIDQDLEEIDNEIENDLDNINKEMENLDNQIELDDINNMIQDQERED